MKALGVTVFRPPAAGGQAAVVGGVVVESDATVVEEASQWQPLLLDGAEGNFDGGALLVLKDTSSSRS